jgi:hypothetical protein
MASKSLRQQVGLEKSKPQTPVSASAPPRPAAGAPPQPAKASKPKSVQADAKLVITRSCGHKIGVNYLQQSVCEGCARCARKKKPPRRPTVERLPDNSRFDVLYDAATLTWTGTLTIGEKVFEAQAGAVFRLLGVLDKMYRDSLG